MRKVVLKVMVLFTKEQQAEVIISLFKTNKLINYTFCGQCQKLHL